MTEHQLNRISVRTQLQSVTVRQLVQRSPAQFPVSLRVGNIGKDSFFKFFWFLFFFSVLADFHRHKSQVACMPN